jgi:hypothetical protein
MDLRLRYARHVPFLLLLIFAVLAVIALIPFSIVQRYRLGTSRRLARGWVATLNMTALAFSAVLVVAGAAMSSVWVPDAFSYTVMGLAGGCLLGALGLALSRWEATPRSLYYTPNRWLVLTITLVVTARLFYGFWRGWQTWQSGLSGSSWLAASGAAGSMAAGAVVLGYYLTYWAGVRRRFKGWRLT